MGKSILNNVHETAKGLHRAGVMDGKTMREFDVLCLPPVKKHERGADQAPAVEEQGESGGICGLSEYKHIHSAEMGAGSAKA